MEEVIVTSKKWWLDKKDFAKGLLVAVITAPITIIAESLQVGNFTIDWKMIASVAITSGLAYLVKNFGTESKTVIVKK